MSDIHVTIIILNWNHSQDTLNCLESLATNDIYQPTLIMDGQHEGEMVHTTSLVVDNGSTDNSVVAIREAYPDITIMELDDNLGFAAGMNRGIQTELQKGATLVSPNFVAHMLECVSYRVGLVAPFVYYVDPSDEIWSMGHNFNRLLWEINDVDYDVHINSSENIVCDAITGCAMLIKRSVIEEIGFFDERFFMYYEDLDFCIRAGNHGYETVVTPHAKIWHHVSKSTGGRNSPAERFHIALSGGRYYSKWMRPWQAPVIISYRLLSALRCTLRLSRQGKWRALGAYWRGLRYGWLGDINRVYSM